MMIKRPGLFRSAALAATLGLFVATGMAAQTSSGVAKPVKKATPATAGKLVLEPRAIALLKATAARLAAAKSMSFTATAGYEYPSQLGPAILYTSRYDVTMQRPNKLKVLMPGDGPVSEFYYDGTTMMAFAPVEHLTAFADAPPTIDSMLKKAYESAGIYYPFTDLILSDPYAALVEGAKLAFYIGTSEHVGNTKTDMVAWSDDNVFIQIWIGADDKLPRRIRAVFSADPKRMRHEVDFSNWQLDPQVAAGTFASDVAQAAPRMAFANPVAAPPVGVKPLMEKETATAKAKTKAVKGTKGNTAAAGKSQ